MDVTIGWWWIAAALVVFAALLFIPPVYRRWMAFAEWLGIWTTRVLFTLIYFTVVPIVRLLRAVSVRSHQDGGSGSLWIARRAPDRSLEDMERMG